MTTRTPQTYRDPAEAAWRWVMDQVRWEDGPWIPAAVTVPDATEAPWDRDGMHSGVGGLAHLLAEIRLTRPWTTEESSLADAIAERLRVQIPTQADCTFFDGLVSSVGALTALGAPGSDAAVARLTALATSGGWPQTAVGPPRFLPGAAINDLTLGSAGVLLAAVWLHRLGTTDADALADTAAGVLLTEAESLPSGTNWPFVPRRFCTDAYPAMPNLSHGVAGVAAALAVAGHELDRPDLTAAAQSGAEHLVTLGDTSEQGLVVPRTIPAPTNGDDEVTYTWCHGPTGTSLLFLALDRAGVEEVAGEPVMSWHRRCLHSVRASGVPARLYPGFWDNDGRCCGTAGAGDVFLDAWHRTGEEDLLEFALHLADTLVERAVVDGPRAYWRFIEHRAAEPLLPPGVGWMQGAAGIAAFLFHVSRVVQDEAQADAVRRLDNWWALPAGP